MSALPDRSTLAGSPSRSTLQTLLLGIYDMLAQRLAAGTTGAGAATFAELLLARNSLGLGAGSDITSAATLDLSARTGNIVRITGSTGPITSVTLENGGWVWAYIESTPTLTYHATNMPLKGGLTYTCKAGDVAIFTRDGNGVLSVEIIRTDGLAMAGEKMPTVGASTASNALTVTIGPETLFFRSATLTSGAPVMRGANSQGSLVVPSTATLGMTSAVKGRLYWGWLDNAGTMEPWICYRTGNGAALDESVLYSTTAIGVGSLSSDVIYSTNARTNVAIRNRAWCDISESTAGTWNTDPTQIQPIGGGVAVPPVLGHVQVYTGNGFGTTNTCIPRFATIGVNVGDDITYADSATLGPTFTINRAGLYSAVIVDAMASGGLIGASVNSTALSTTISDASITPTTRIALTQPNSSSPGSCSFLRWFKAGDVIRPHYNAVARVSNAFSCFDIARIL